MRGILIGGAILLAVAVAVAGCGGGSRAVTIPQPSRIRPVEEVMPMLPDTNAWQSIACGPRPKRSPGNWACRVGWKGGGTVTFEATYDDEIGVSSITHCRAIGSPPMNVCDLLERAADVSAERRTRIDTARAASPRDWFLAEIAERNGSAE
jgi:hypothetical protein